MRKLTRRKLIQHSCILCRNEVHIARSCHQLLFCDVEFISENTHFSTDATLQFFRVCGSVVLLVCESVMLLVDSCKNIGLFRYDASERVQYKTKTI